MATTVWKHWASGLALGLAALLAHAQEDPPGRVARLSMPDAAVQWAPAGSNDWQGTEANWPLTSGDRVRLPAGQRTELQVGNATLRLQGPAQLEIGALDDANLRLTLAAGSLNLAVRELAPDERIEVGTANLAMVVDRPGEFRIDADPAGDTTAIGVRAGAVTVYGENGESSPLAAPRQARYAGRQLLPLATPGLGARDGLDQWAAERMRAEEQSISARYVSRDTIGYQELDAQGEWASDATYGAVWYPRVTVADWAPYRYGQWRWVAPWGWTWIDDARWGFAPFHYGRWIQTGTRWGWAPGPWTRRPAYAPALVGFVGTPGHRPPPGRPHGPGSDWFPLAPGEAWRPPFGASPHYLDRVNRGLARPDASMPPRYHFQRRPDAVSTTPPPRPLPPNEGVRSTSRERPPVATPGPQWGQPGSAPGFPRERHDPERRERWQRDQQQTQNPSGNEFQRRNEQIRQEQQQRELSARQQQRMLQDQQAQQMQQQRQQQEQQQRQLREPQRQHERFVRDQQESQQRQLQQQQQQAMREQLEQQRRQQMVPPRTAMPERRGNADENRGGRPEGRERRQDRER